MTRGDRVRVAAGSPLRAQFGEAVGDVTEADPEDARCSVHFPTMQCFAIGCRQDGFEVVEAAEVPELADCGCADEG